MNKIIAPFNNLLESKCSDKNEITNTVKQFIEASNSIEEIFSTVVKIKNEIFLVVEHINMIMVEKLVLVKKIEKLAFEMFPDESEFL